MDFDTSRATDTGAMRWRCSHMTLPTCGEKRRSKECRGAIAKFHGAPGMAAVANPEPASRMVTAPAFLCIRNGCRRFGGTHERRCAGQINPRAAMLVGSPEPMTR